MSVLKNGSEGSILMEITIDDFLIVASQLRLIHHFYNVLRIKYAVKRLGRQTVFLGWTVTYPHDRSIILSQQSLVLTKISNGRTADMNGRLKPY